MYPTKHSIAWSQEARWMRKIIGCCICLHILCFIAALTAIGFGPMIADLVLMTYGYSVYLTLNSCEIILYTVLMCVFVVTGITSACEFEFEDPTSLMGMLVNCGLLVA